MECAKPSKDAVLNPWRVAKVANSPGYFRINIADQTLQYQRLDITESNGAARGF